MDYVGTVSFVDAQAQRLVCRKYRLPSDVAPAFLVERMMLDLRHALEQGPSLKVAVVQDGAPEMWKAVVGALRTEPEVDEWDEVVDWYHVDERLGTCAELCAKQEVGRKTQRARWHRLLLQNEDGIRRVMGSLRRHARRLPDESKQTVLEHVRYFGNHRTRTNYARYRRQGIPIGSGVTEGACKSLVNVRAKRSGQRWCTTRTHRGVALAFHPTK